MNKLLNWISGAFVATAISCSTDYSIDVPIYSETDGQYDVDAIVKLIDSNELITEITPTITDFINEFYAFTDQQKDLLDINVKIVDVLPNSDSSDLAGKFNCETRLATLEQQPFNSFMMILMHEIDHQYECNNNHDKIEASETARALLLYMFEPRIGISILTGHNHDESKINENTIMATGKLFDPGFFGYSPILWNQIIKQGSIVDSLDYILRQTEVDKLDVELDTISNIPLHELILDGIKKLKDSNSLTNEGTATSGQNNMLFGYLLQRAFAPNNISCTEYLKGAEMIAEEKSEVDPFLLSFAIGCIKSDSLINSINKYIPLIDNSESINASLWPNLNTAKTLIDRSYNLLLSVAHDTGNKKEYELSNSELDTYIDNLNIATNFTKNYLKKHTPSSMIINTILQHIEILVNADDEFKNVVLDYESAATLYPFVFEQFYENSEKDYISENEWFFIRHIPFAVNTFLESASNTIESSADLYNKMDLITSQFITKYGTTCENGDEYPIKLSKAYSFAAQAIINYNLGYTDDARNLLTLVEECDIGLKGKVSDLIQQIK